MHEMSEPAVARVGVLPLASRLVVEAAELRPGGCGLRTRPGSFMSHPAASADRTPSRAVLTLRFLNVLQVRFSRSSLRVARSDARFTPSRGAFMNDPGPARGRRRSSSTMAWHRLLLAPCPHACGARCHRRSSEGRVAIRRAFPVEFPRPRAYEPRSVRPLAGPARSHSECPDRRVGVGRRGCPGGGLEVVMTTEPRADAACRRGPGAHGMIEGSLR